MGRLIGRYLAQALLVLTPIFAPLFVSSFKLQPLITRVFGASCLPSEGARAGLSFVFLAIVFVYDAIDLYLPRESRRRFRNRYLTSQFEELRPQLHKDVRV